MYGEVAPRGKLRHGYPNWLPPNAGVQGRESPVPRRMAEIARHLDMAACPDRRRQIAGLWGHDEWAVSVIDVQG